MRELERERERFHVVTNTDGEYSIWSTRHPLPGGWRSTGFEGSQTICLQYVTSLQMSDHRRALPPYDAQDGQRTPAAMAALNAVVRSHRRESQRTHSDATLFYRGVYMNLSDTIEKTGYCHMKSFLSPDEINGLRQFYENAPPPSNNLYPTLDIGLVPDTIDKSVMDKLHALHAEVFPGELFIDESMTFFPVLPTEPSRSVNLPYHQDHESFFLCNEHYHYLNAWMILEKGDPQHSNLTIIPFDALASKSPLLRDYCRGNGATVVSGDYLQNDNLGTWYKLDFKIDDIAVTPHMEVGDLLLIRGDILHRTQNQLTHRVALSLRAVRAGAVLERRALYSGSTAKLWVLAKNHHVYGCVDFVFNRMGVDLITMSDYISNKRRIDEELCTNAWLSKDFHSHLEKY